MAEWAASLTLELGSIMSMLGSASQKLRRRRRKTLRKVMASGEVERPEFEEALASFSLRCGDISVSLWIIMTRERKQLRLQK